MKEEKREINKFRFGIWLSVGLMCSMIFAAMYISEDGTLDCFYNVGEVYDVFSSVYKYGGTEWNYDALEHNITISGEEALKTIAVTGKMRNWNFCVIEISHMNRPSMSAVIECISADGEITGNFPVELTEGRNQIFLEGVAFSQFVIKISGQAGTQFEINKLQLRLQDPDASIGRILKLSGFAFFLYILLSYMVVKVKEKRFSNIHINFYGMIEGLQKMFCKVANMYGRYFRNISGRIRTVVWECCFFILIFYTIILFNTGQYLKSWRYSQVVYTVMVFIIAVFSIEDEIRPVCWRNRLVYAWVTFWTLAAISDFIVKKSFSGVGVVQILVWGFCFLIWNNMEYPYRLLRALMNAVRNSFLVVIIFCLCCRPDVVGGRYMGIFTNPNTFANYLVVVAAVLMTDITYMLLQKRNKGMVMDCMGLLAVFVFLWKTQTRGAMIAIGATVILAGWYLVMEKRKQGYRLLGKWILYMALLLAPVQVGLSWGISNIPVKLGTVVIMENDFAMPAAEGFSNLGVTKVYAAGVKEKVEQSRIWQTLKRGSLEEISSGRTVYWKAYVRDMNLWGHVWKATVSGRTRDAHNALLAIAYRYGVFIIIPYIILWSYSLIYGIKYLNFQKQAYGFLPFSFNVSYMILSLVDTVEQPYVSVIWFAVYFVFGILFVSEEKNIEKLNSVK